MKPPYRPGGPRSDQGPRDRGPFKPRGPRTGDGGGERSFRSGPARPDAGAFIDRPARAPYSGGPRRDGDGAPARTDEGRPARGFKPRFDGARGDAPRGGYRGDGDRSGGGFRPRPEGGDRDGGGGGRFAPRSGFAPRGEGRPPRREEGFRPSGPREGGERSFRPRAEGEGGFRPRREGDGGGFRPRREGEGGGFKPRGEGGAGFRPRPEGGAGFRPRGEGGGEGFRPRGEGGFKPRGEGFRPRRDGEGGGEGFRPRRDAGDRPPQRSGPRFNDAARGADERPAYPGERRFESAYRAFDRSGDDPRNQQTRARIAEADSRSAQAAAREVDLAEQRRNEFRVHGLNAVLALYRDRPEAIRKLWFTAQRRDVLADVITHCAQRQVGYNESEAIELERIAGSEHHEGVVAAVLRPELPAPAAALTELAASEGPQLVLLLDGVANPHNLGAILRSAAHFGAAAVVLMPGSASAYAGAVYRVAEGGAEAQPVVMLDDPDALQQLRDAGFQLAVTAADASTSLLDAQALPERLLLALGAESHGVSEALRAQADLHLAIPGSGAVESLNVAAAAAVGLAVWRSVHPQ